MSHGSVDLSREVRGGYLWECLIKLYYMVRDILTTLDARRDRV